MKRSLLGFKHATVLIYWKNNHRLGLNSAQIAETFSSGTSAYVITQLNYLRVDFTLWWWQRKGRCWNECNMYHIIYNILYHIRIWQYVRYKQGELFSALFAHFGPETRQFRCVFFTEEAKSRIRKTNMRFNSCYCISIILDWLVDSRKAWKNWNRENKYTTTKGFA